MKKYENADIQTRLMTGPFRAQLKREYGIYACRHFVVSMSGGIDGEKRKGREGEKERKGR